MAVSRVARQALRFTSVPKVRISLRPKICCEFPATKPRTTPEPVPTSTTSGDVEDGPVLVFSCVSLLSENKDGSLLNRWESQADSDGEESVSRKR